MKVKLISIILSLAVAILLIGCNTASTGKPVIEKISTEEQSEGEIINEVQQTESEVDGILEEDEPIEVDKGIFSVEITLPASFFQDQDISDIANETDDSDIKVTVNDNGSVTYKMSKSKHNELMVELYNNQIEYIDEIKSSGDYESIRDITFNKTFSEITLLVDQEEFENSFDGFIAFGIGITSLYYQLFNGVNPDDYKVTIYFKNVESGEIFGNVVYPDAFEE